MPAYFASIWAQPHFAGTLAASGSAKWRVGRKGKGTGMLLSYLESAHEA